ncbi:MAG: hypothetical protein FJ147_10150 [Deltaproteobacteria bacterium]|nr:hypothetical protein [Deltaproteobacteria bacterium]
MLAAVYQRDMYPLITWGIMLGALGILSVVSLIVVDDAPVIAAQLCGSNATIATTCHPRRILGA